MDILRATVADSCFRDDLSWLPYNLKKENFVSVMGELYDFFFELNKSAVGKGWERLEDMLPAAALSGMLSPMLGASLAKYSRSLVVNALPNGHPDLLPKGRYKNNYALEAADGVEVKATKNLTAQVDMHSDRTGWLCTFVYRREDDLSKPLEQRMPLQIEEIFLGNIVSKDFRFNARGERGTKTASLDSSGLARYRPNWVYVSEFARKSQWFKKWLKSQEQPVQE